jgi:hypothetical protein
LSYNPLEVGGVGDYPVKVGSMLLTLVDPNKGYERAYNRWYERDHFYGGCMIGPYTLAGSRWVAPRQLKDLRWPRQDNSVATPWNAGSYVAIYFVEKDHHKDFFDWGSKQVRALYGGGRGFNERTHVHTILYDYVDAAYRDDDPVPVDLALDAAYDGIVLAWFDGAPSSPPNLSGSNIEIASNWVPTPGQERPPGTPMDLGSGPGGADRALRMYFVRGDVTEALPAIEKDTEGANLVMAAPFFRTAVGTDTYTDQLW